jgi:hypothetical protein
MAREIWAVSYRIHPRTKKRLAGPFLCRLRLVRLIGEIIGILLRFSASRNVQKFPQLITQIPRNWFFCARIPKLNSRILRKEGFSWACRSLEAVSASGERLVPRTSPEHRGQLGAAHGWSPIVYAGISFEARVRHERIQTGANFAELIHAFNSLKTMILQSLA